MHDEEPSRYKNCKNCEITLQLVERDGLKPYWIHAVSGDLRCLIFAEPEPETDLSELPDGSILRSANGHAYEKSMKFTMIGRRWLEAGNASPERTEDIPLPVTVLYQP